MNQRSGGYQKQAVAKAVKDGLINVKITTGVLSWRIHFKNVINHLGTLSPPKNVILLSCKQNRENSHAHI